MARAGRPKVRQYSLEFKLKAVKLSQLPGVEVQAVADALEIHLKNFRALPLLREALTRQINGTKTAAA